MQVQVAQLQVRDGEAHDGRLVHLRSYVGCEGQLVGQRSEHLAFFAASVAGRIPGLLLSLLRVPGNNNSQNMSVSTISMSVLTSVCKSMSVSTISMC